MAWCGNGSPFESTQTYFIDTYIWIKRHRCVKAKSRGQWVYNWQLKYILNTRGIGGFLVLSSVRSSFSPITGPLWGNPPVTSHQNKLLNKQSRGRWVETWWRSCDITVMFSGDLGNWDDIVRVPYTKHQTWVIHSTEVVQRLINALLFH